MTKALKIIRNGKGLNFTVHSKNAPEGKTFYNLNFDPVCNYFGITLEINSVIVHYNKFEKTWGKLQTKGARYELLDYVVMDTGNEPLLLKLPERVAPEALIRGVLYYPIFEEEGIKSYESLESIDPVTLLSEKTELNGLVNHAISEIPIPNNITRGVTPLTNNF